MSSRGGLQADERSAFRVFSSLWDGVLPRCRDHPLPYLPRKILKTKDDLSQNLEPRRLTSKIFCFNKISAREYLQAPVRMPGHIAPFCQRTRTSPSTGTADGKAEHTQRPTYQATRVPGSAQTRKCLRQNFSNHVSQIGTSQDQVELAFRLASGCVTSRTVHWLHFEHDSRSESCA